LPVQEEEEELLCFLLLALSHGTFTEKEQTNNSNHICFCIASTKDVRIYLILGLLIPSVRSCELNVFKVIFIIL
ncbi:hypothetical protein ACJX0J_040182, partial [Zea mays]